MTLVGTTQTSLKNHALAKTLQAGWRVYFQVGSQKAGGSFNELPSEDKKRDFVIQLPDLEGNTALSPEQ